ncbi:MAG: DNA recombination protein RmuC [Candidatus Curtissbacteria bacterium]|nr:DNA recombination protein RmuC [Candidatus Curtissbacteria bacterium]
MDSQTILLVVGVLVLATMGLLYLQIKKLADNKKSDETTKLLSQLVSDMRGSMDNTTDSMVRQTKAINERLDRAAQVISEVSKSVGEMTELGRGMKDLQEFLRSPKMRGQMGEAGLKDLLGQSLPKQNFHLQYAFKSGEIVDAALKLEQGIIPIDAKFPMENIRKMSKAQDEKEKLLYRKAFINDVKKHIDAISSKYIKPQEGTIDFALMYIPSEVVYYEILTESPELEEYAYRKRVRPVSPNTLYAYLRAIIMSLEGNKIERQAGQILAALREIADETEKFSGSLSLLTKHIKNAANSSDDVNTRFARLSSKISTVQTIEDRTVKSLKSKT